MRHTTASFYGEIAEWLKALPTRTVSGYLNRLVSCRHARQLLSQPDELQAILANPEPSAGQPARFKFKIGEGMRKMMEIVPSQYRSRFLSAVIKHRMESVATASPDTSVLGEERAFGRKIDGDNHP